MSKIVLSKDAPEGQPLSAAFGPLHFDAGKAQSFDTDDGNLLSAAAAHPYFEVEYDKKDSSGADALKEADEARRQHEKDNEYNATKPPTAPPAEAEHETSDDDRKGN